MSQKKSNGKKQSNPRNLYNKRKCYVCGEEHEKDQICPQILETLRVAEKKNIRVNFWGNVFVQCVKRNKNFLQLIYEICELTEVLLGNPYHYDPIHNPIHNGNISYTLKGRFSHNIELTLEYCSAFIGCKISDFFMKEDALFHELYLIISTMKHETEVLDEVDYDDESYSLSMECVSDDFFDTIPANIMDPRYKAQQLKLCFNKKFDGTHQTYNLYFELPKAIGYTCHEFVDCDWASHRYIPLYYDFQGKFQALYEKLSCFKYHELVQTLPCSDNKFIYWKTQIVNACHNHSIIWTRTYERNRYIYATVYKDANIEFTVNQTKEIYILTVFKNGFTYEFFVNKDEDEENKNKIINLFKEIYRSWKETSSNLEQKDIGYSDVIITSNSLSCKTHSLIAYRGLVHILTPDFKEEIYELYVSYCQDCGTYRALTTDYEELLKHGTPLCKVYSNNKELKTDKENTFTYKSQSILHIMGYTVKADSELTEEERRNILVTAIQNKLISSNEAIGFLNWLVDTRKGRTGYAMAVKKWTSDILFLKELTKDDRETIEVDTLYV